MLKPIVACLRWLRSRARTEVAQAAKNCDEPDKARRMLVLGGTAAVIGTSLLLPALTTPAEAHRRRRRLRRRRHRHRHYSRRRRRHYYHGGHSHRHGYHRHHRRPYYYRRPYYRPAGVHFYFGF